MHSELESHSTKLVDIIYGSLISKYSIKDLMDMVRKNKEFNIFIVVERIYPSDVEVVVDREGIYRYNSGEILMIPVPKRFAVLEPDENYFVMTLKANIFLALCGADERELHA